MKRYIHFTSLRHALRIKQSQRLWRCSYVTGVYATEVGGEYIPGVQRGTHGRAENRDYAVMFSTDERPHFRAPEEVVWHTQTLLISAPKCLRAEEAAKLLDGSANIPDPMEAR